LYYVAGSTFPIACADATLLARRDVDATLLAHRDVDANATSFLAYKDVCATNAAICDVGSLLAAEIHPPCIDSLAI